MPGVRVLGELRVRYHEYEIRVGMLNHLQREIDSLRRVQGMGISAAPEIVALIPITPGRNGVLITRYSVCPGEELEHIEDKTPLSPAALRGSTAPAARAA